MTKQTKEQDTGCSVCRCEGCCAQISASTALTFEGADYIRHFCGQACYDKWQAQNPPTEED